MDPFTHALSGAVAARATAPPDNHDLPDVHTRTLAGTGAALFPDIDIVLRFVDPMFYFTHHRGLTHSFVMAPVWALLLAVFFALILHRGRYSWSAFYGVSLIGIGVHIVGDLINEYGTQIFAPLTTAKFQLGTTFVLDPWLTLILVLGLAASLQWQPRIAARMTLIGCAALIALQWTQKQHALALADYYEANHEVYAETVHAIPQPFHPFHWKLVLAERDRYYVSYVNLALDKPLSATDQAWILPRMLAAYRPAGALHWDRYHRHAPGDRNRSRRAWESETMAPYRDFARLPAWYETTRNPPCVWFQDLRFRSPEMQPSFVYGVCNKDGQEQLYRLAPLTREPEPAMRPSRDEGVR